MISDDAVLEGVDPSVHVVHSAEKLKRMSRVLRYPEDEDDSTQEVNVRQQKPSNRKRQKGTQESTLALLLEKIEEIIESDASKEQEDTWRE
ncbi:hypothetical protein BBJ28_00021221 [Nothophytophthora sp. Chile5]|nr:hypothetical protein BBJ28_00021221 [Nothophytophthora sp. Chile5]